MIGIALDGEKDAIEIIKKIWLFLAIVSNIYGTTGRVTDGWGEVGIEILMDCWKWYSSGLGQPG